MAVRENRGDVKQTTAGFRGPLMAQDVTSATSKFLSLMNDIAVINKKGCSHVSVTASRISHILTDNRHGKQRPDQNAQ
jgi:hypothetical protein